MLEAKLGALGNSVETVAVKQGFLKSEKKSTVTCYVCPDCGYIAFNADHPEYLT